ncbi:MAG TPA: MoxR family ATPase, partial [Candidatus Thermoplasmatota archaeon]|nr:MoxR family ATPase [Candidatus Thermoplasmatota archaeon]
MAETPLPATPPLPTAAAPGAPGAGNPLCARILDNVSGSFVGDRNLLKKLLAGALANGHVLFEDYPGLGKTLLVKVFARSLGCESNRVQFTPDILPADILGTRIWSQRTQGFELVKGPVFTNVLLADEINRAPPKTQSALLEAMEERQVTIEGTTHKLEAPFFVLATQNPIEQEGTYPLPEAQMDRFLLKLSTGYPPTLEAETEILRRRLSWRKDDPTEDVKAVVDAATFRKLQERVEMGVYVHPAILAYIGKLVRGLREHPQVEVGPSPRGALALLRLSRSLAFINGRDFVTPDDVKFFAEDALAHRTLLDLENVLDGVSSRQVVRDVLNRVDVPTRFNREAAG